MLSLIYSFYGGFNDDFNYHYETIKNFKNKNLYEILHHRNISYNSHWLFLTSIYSLNYFTSTLFTLSTLIFSITIYDLINISKKTLKDKTYHLLIISFFLLIFLLGVMNKIKEFGTDFPGVIISIYVTLIIFYYIFDIKEKYSNRFFFIIFFLCQLALIIKLSNALIFIFVFYLFWKLKFNTINYWLFFLISIIPLPWIFQNFIISGCLIWPISITCFANTELAIHETYLIESFAKGDITTSINVNSFSWINVWFINHAHKIFETYFLFFILLFLPVLYLIYKSNKQRRLILETFTEKYKEENYKIIFIIILSMNLLWFFYAPAYRFGIFYNLSLIIIFFIPFWLSMFKYNFKFIYNYSRFVCIIIFLYFLYENIEKVDWYTKRYDVWPPIYEGKLLDRKNF